MRIRKIGREISNIFERSLDAIIHTDRKGKIMEINQAGLHILGYRTKKELFWHGTVQGRKVRRGFEDWTDEESERYISTGEQPEDKPLLKHPEWW